MNQHRRRSRQYSDLCVVRARATQVFGEHRMIGYNAFLDQYSMSAQRY